MCSEMQAWTSSILIHGIFSMYGVLIRECVCVSISAEKEWERVIAINHNQVRWEAWGENDKVRQTEK